MVTLQSVAARQSQDIETCCGKCSHSVSMYVSFCVFMQYPLANADSYIGVKNLSNTCVRIKIYSVMKKCESKTMPYI